jgi:beta-galactosidase
MKDWSRRQLLKSGVALQAAVGEGPQGAAQQAKASSEPTGYKEGPQLRERLLLDFGWRFHFGHAADPTKDFGFGLGRSGGFQKTGDFLAPAVWLSTTVIGSRSIYRTIG